jgi:rare lipoprotein A
VGPAAVGPSCTASHYGAESGRVTASGRHNDPTALHAAHLTLPFGTRVRVSRGMASVVVVIDDRGPYVAGRTIDLSDAAFGALAQLSEGVITARCEVLT